MNFWDSSALVPLVIQEDTSRECRKLFASRQPAAAWVLSHTEVLSALRRHVRMGSLTEAGYEQARDGLNRIAARWIEIDAVHEVRSEADRLLSSHPLKAADALQLGAALVAARVGGENSLGFICLDTDLCTAAAKEGFHVVQPASP